MENKDKLWVKVIMLPTEEASKLVLYKDDLTNFVTHYPEARSVHASYGFSQQHLYFVSDREIKEGDWCIHRMPEKEKKYAIIKCTKGNRISIQEWWRRIEATTDSSLNLPLIPESFIEVYCEARGEIDEVMIEIGYDPTLGEDSPFYPIIKTRKNNTVIVSKMKDSWTREEVKKILINFYYIVGEGLQYTQIENWLRRNL